MRLPRPWRRTACDPTTDGSEQALADAQLVLETAHLRWHRVNAAAERAAESNAKVRSQREQNHLAEIVYAALHGGRHKP